MELNDVEVTTPPRDAASVVLLRPSPEGALEVLLMRRHAASGVLGGAFVFPGGKVDSADGSRCEWLSSALTSQNGVQGLIKALDEPTLSERQGLALYVAAARETLEEAAVRLAITDLYPWSRWITPRTPSMMRQRFDTRFFVAILPDGQQVRYDEHETVEALWIEPRAALARYWSSAMTLAPPQIMSLAHLAQLGSPQAALSAARARGPRLIEPESFTDTGGGRVMTYPGDPRHSVPMRRIPGPSRLYWRNDRFEPEGGFEGFFN